MRIAAIAALTCASLAATPALAQSVNLRMGSFQPVPGPSFGAATGQTGAWNPVNHEFSWGGGEGPNQLVDLAGQPTSASAGSFGCDTSWCLVEGWSDDVVNLFSSFANGDCYVDPNFTTISGLEPGHYVMTLYGTTCFPSPHNVYVQLSDGSFSDVAALGGAYDGSFDNMTLGVVAFDLAAGVDVRIQTGTWGAMCAVQLTQLAQLATYCTSKLNSQGCTAKIGASVGDFASISGATPFVIGASDVVTNTAGLFFYGFASDIKPFKGGFHCVQAPTPRTPAQFSGGTAGVNCSGSFSIDFNGYLQTPPASNVEPGMTLYGQYWYRDPNDPMGFDSATSDAIVFGVAP